MTITDILETVRRCESPGFTFVVHNRYQDMHTHESYYLQVEFQADGKAQKGRKWLLSTYMTRNELVQTCLLAVMTAVEHEVREKFTYRGRKIYGPHWDPDALWEVSVARSLDLREVTDK